MGLTKQFLRYEAAGSCGVVGSTDGAIVAVDSDTCAVTACENVNVYNFRTAELSNQLHGKKLVTSLKFSKNRRLLAVGYADGSVVVHDRNANAQNSEITFCGHRTGVNCLAFSDDGLTLASGGKDSVIILWDIVNESGLFRLKGHKGSITQLRFTRNDRYLLSSSKDTLLKFWNLSTRSCFYTITDHRSEVYTFAVIKDESQLITGSAELELRLFQLTWIDNLGRAADEQQIDCVVNDLQASVKRLKTDPDMESLVEDPDDNDQANTIVRCKKLGAILRASKGRALQFCVSPDEQLLICLASGPVADIFRIYTFDETQKRIAKKIRKAKKKAVAEEMEIGDNIEGDVRKDLTVYVSRVSQYKADVKIKWADFAPQTYDSGENGTVYTLMALHKNNSVHKIEIRSLKSGEILAESAGNLNNLGHRSEMRAVAFSNDDFALVTVGGDSAIVWNRHSLNRVQTLSDDVMCRDVTAATFVTGDRHCILATKAGNLLVFDMASNELLETIKAHDGAISGLFPFTDSKGLISYGSDKKVRFWLYELVSTADRKQQCLTLRDQRRVLELPDECLCSALSEDGRWLAAGLLNNTVSVHFLDTLRFSLSLYGHSLPVLCLDISTDSQLIVTGSSDKNLKIWGLDFGDCHRSLFAHDDSVTCVKFSPKSHLFWSAGRDGKVKQWDGDKFDRIQTLDTGHFGAVTGLALGSGDRFVATCGADGALRLWSRTEEILVVQEEKEREREEGELDGDLLRIEDVIPGENTENTDVDIAAKKTIESIKSTESIIDAIEIVRQEKLDDCLEQSNNRQPHPLVKALASPSLDHFLVDVLAKVRSSDLEKSLLLVPFAFVFDLLQSCGECIAKNYKIELTTRVVLFLLRIHHNQIVGADEEMVKLIDRLRYTLPNSVDQLRDVCGFNRSALQLLMFEIEQKQSIKLFKDASDRQKERTKKEKARNRADYIMSLV